MSTSNFHNVNAKNVFAVEIEDEYDFDDLRDNLFHELGLELGGYDADELRSYPSSVVGNLIVGDVRISVIIRSGYYTGCNLDWAIQYGDYDDYNDYCDMINCDDTLTDTEKARFKLTTKNVTHLLIDKVEKVFTNFSQPLRRVATFSNGETIYEKV